MSHLAVEALAPQQSEEGSNHLLRRGGSGWVNLTSFGFQAEDVLLDRKANARQRALQEPPSVATMRNTMLRFPQDSILQFQPSQFLNLFRAQRVC